MCHLPPFTACPSAVPSVSSFPCSTCGASLAGPTFSRLLSTCVTQHSEVLHKHTSNLIAANSSNGHVVAHLSAVLILKEGHSYKYIMPYGAALFVATFHTITRNGL